MVESKKERRSTRHVMSDGSSGERMIDTPVTILYNEEKWHS